MSELKVFDKINKIDQDIQKNLIEKNLLLEKALKSDDIDSIYKAQTYLNQINKKNTPNPQSSSIIMDPDNISGSGYRIKSSALSNQILRNMARTPIIKAIIKARKEQINGFLEPQTDRYSTGFIIKPIKSIRNSDGNYNLTNKQKKEIEYLTEFVLNCGDNDLMWHGDDFQTLTKKFIEDSLTLDQACIEKIVNRRGEIIELLATDSSLYRVASTYGQENNPQYKNLLVNGYLPRYVQTYRERIFAEFYPWELCFAIRNPVSDIFNNGYGRSELEDLINTVTALLNSDQYNANYFTVGSTPKGILKVSGNVNPNTLRGFKESWQAEMAGVRNSHKLAVIEADKMDFVTTQQSNRDMEWSKYQEFLLKIACSHYTIDPSEIGFHLSGSSGSQSLFESNQENRIKYSKDKGLKPLIKFWQRVYNQNFLLPKSNYQYELEFVGLDSETSQQELENDTKAVQNWCTVNEIRAKRGMKPLPDGDIILNPIIAQQKMLVLQGGQGMNQFVNDNEVDEDEDINNDTNPFQKSLQEDINRILSEE